MAEVQGEVGDSSWRSKLMKIMLMDALIVLKRILQKEGLFSEIKRRKSYEKPVNECGGDDENTC
jgi:Ribosomal protein S21